MRRTVSLGSPFTPLPVSISGEDLQCVSWKVKMVDHQEDPSLWAGAVLRYKAERSVGETEITLTFTGEESQKVRRLLNDIYDRYKANEQQEKS